MKVFVSGTSRDLGPFRTAVAEQLKLLGAESVVQDYFSPDHLTLKAMLENKLKTCDAVICLIGSVFGAAPPDSTRSYTQMEYDFAKDLRKPTYVFFPLMDCEPSNSVMDQNSDTPDQRELQSQYADSLRRNTEYKYYTFDSSDNLLTQVSQIVVTLWDEVAAGPTARMVRTDFPTPLATKYHDWSAKLDLASTTLFLTALLRFITVLAAHDSLVHRNFGAQSVDRRERIPTLARPAGPADWHTLLRLACPHQTDIANVNFVGELADWANRDASALDNAFDKILAYDGLVAAGRNSEAERMSSDLRTAMRSLLAELEFLKRYVLVAVTEVDSRPGNCSVTLLRGLDPRRVELTRDDQSALRPQKNQLYLLDLHRSRALWLSPAFERNGATREDRVYIWNGLDRNVPKDVEVNSECVVATMTPVEGDTVLIPVRRDILTAWVGEELANDAFGFQVQPPALEWRGKLFDDDSWNRLREVILPPGEPSVLGDRFQLLGEPLHRGLLANVFEAKDLAAGEANGEEELVVVPRRTVVHVLREDGAADEQIRASFISRSECWRETKHPQVLKLHGSGDPAGTKGLPFLVTDLVPDARPLKELAPPGASLDARKLMQVTTLAAEVCGAAHQRGVFLLALPPRHFLMEGDNLFLTGFESAVAGTVGAEFPPSLLKGLSRFSSDVDMMAPEVRRDFGTFAPTLDVFAIGSLVAELYRYTIPADAMPVLPTQDWKDPWRCLVYHCLATDPTVRFQSTEQLLMFLDEWPPCTEPRTVSIPRKETEPGICIGKYPVTNAEYKRFCSEREYPLPLHLSDPWQRQEERRAEISRLGGPWLPVTYVSLLDAKEYCVWLSERTRKKWRLPTEAEWLRAAARSDDDVYPWGDAPPDRGSCNYGGYYRGPTVVGAFPRGRSHADCWDMAGNVWEWCTNFIATGAPRRLVKGGAHDYSADALKLTGGDARVVTCRSPHVGFRVVCEEEP